MVDLDAKHTWLIVQDLHGGDLLHLEVTTLDRILPMQTLDLLHRLCVGAMLEPILLQP